jgi:hypothetical protein
MDRDYVSSIAWKLYKTAVVLAGLFVAGAVVMFVVGAIEYRRQTVAFKCTRARIPEDVTDVLFQSRYFPASDRQSWDAWAKKAGVSIEWPSAEGAGPVSVLSAEVPSCGTRILFDSKLFPPARVRFGFTDITFEPSFWTASDFLPYGAFGVVYGLVVLGALRWLRWLLSRPRRPQH